MYSVLSLKYSLLIYIKEKQTRYTIQRKNKDKLDSTFNRRLSIIYLYQHIMQSTEYRQTD